MNVGFEFERNAVKKLEVIDLTLLLKVFYNINLLFLPNENGILNELRLFQKII